MLTLLQRGAHFGVMNVDWALVEGTVPVRGFVHVLPLSLLGLSLLDLLRLPLVLLLALLSVGCMTRRTTVVRPSASKVAWLNMQAIVRRMVGPKEESAFPGSD